MAENIMENGKTINKMELVNSSMPMELFSMVTGLMELRTEMDSNNGKMAQNTLEIGSITLCKESVITSLPMEVSMKENGLIISSMDMENKPGQMVENMRDNSIMVLNKVKVFNGKKYDGALTDGKQNGEGMFTTSKGENRRGIWANG
jgi:hypothetical protein